VDGRRERLEVLRTVVPLVVDEELGVPATPHLSAESMSSAIFTTKRERHGQARNLQEAAKLLVRWRREENFSMGGRIRQLERYRSLSDREALALKFPFTEAQEFIALEAGCASWAELKVSTEAAPLPASSRRLTTLRSRGPDRCCTSPASMPRPRSFGISSASASTSCTAACRSADRGRATGRPCT
jgi:hypothetical protein